MSSSCKTRGIDAISIKLENFLQLPFHVYLKDCSGKYVECNTAQAKSYGASSTNDIIGKADEDFYPQAEASILRENDVKIQESEMPVVLIEQCTFSNSPTTPMLSYKIPVLGTGGKVIGVFGTSVPFGDKELLPQIMPINDDHLIPNQNTITTDGGSHSPVIKGKNISNRERECMEYLIQGMTAKEIARVLNLSPRTIEFYIENLKKKFGCFNRAELVAKVYDIFK